MNLTRRMPAEGANHTDPTTERPSAEEIYERHFDFVWRNARRMGVRDEDVDDAVQDVFVTAHRRLAEFEGRSSIETWLFGILFRVVQHYRRSKARRLNKLEALVRFGDARPTPAEEPLELLSRAEQAETLRRLLDELGDEKRVVFILMELEQRSAPEVAELLGVPLNTVYSRLRVGRQDLERAIARRNAQEKKGVLA